MAIENVEKDIQNRVESQCNKIAVQSSEECDSILKDAKRRVKELEAKRAEKLSRMKLELRNKRLAQARLEGRRVVLRKKKEILDGIYGEVEGTLREMKGVERRKMLGALLEKAKKELDAKYVRSNEGDAEEVKKLGKGLEYAENIECIGGIVLENSKKDIAVDYRFETILKEVRKETLQETAKRVFK
ncbi:MAG: V-type ATP synthase subunit E family protein [archaeon]